LENFRLKKIISEFEDTLSPRPLFVEPLSIVILEPIPKGTPKTYSKVKKVVGLLIGIKKYVAKNISK
jgi:hypothetical protein